MRRQIAAVALLAAVAVTACSNPPASTTARLAGPNSLAVAGDVLLVANTGAAQLNALTLDPNIDNRAFIRAPNPLFPLSIPTSEFPRTVAASVTAAPFAFALSTVANQVSLISTERLALLGIIDVPTTGTALSAAVPAVVAGAPERLAVTATAGGQGTLYVYAFDAALASAPPPLTFPQPSTIALGASVPQVVVASPTNPNQLAIGDRLSGTGAAGALAIVDLAGGTVERFDVGGPIAALAYDQAGTAVFGIYDAEACPAGSECTGVFAFRLSDRALTTTPGQGIRVPGVPRGLAVGKGTLVVPDLGPLTTDMLIAVSSSDGSIYFIDGATGRLVPSRGASSADLSHFDATGARVADANGPNTITASITFPPQEVTIAFEGEFPALANKAGTVTGSTLSAVYDFAGVQVGDLVTFTAPAECATPEGGTVTAVAAGQLELGGLPALCNGAATFSVRAPKGAYLVTGTVSGLMGRVQPLGVFKFPADATEPILSFTMGTGDPNRGAKYVITFAPFQVPLSSFSMPGAVTFAPQLGIFYVAYAGGNAVFELRPSELVPGADNRGVGVFK